MFPNGRTYTVKFSNVSISALQDSIAAVAASGKVLYLMDFNIGQSGTADYGDAQAEGVALRIRSGQTSAGSGGGTYTPVPINVTDAAAGFTARINDTTQASAGTIVEHWTDVWNVQQAYQYSKHGGLWIPMTGSRRLTIEIPVAPADALSSCYATAWFFEVG